MWLMLIPITLCVEAVYHDVKRREIPDSVNARILLTALLVTCLTWHSVTLADALIGMLIGFFAVLPFTLKDGIGGGDLKLVAALGAWLGGGATLGFLFWSAMCGMVMAITTHLLGRKDFPFAPAIASGFLIAICWPNALTRLIELLRG
ncbi:prepilin peptidase [Thalassoglobus polymorphus]|uniref:Leader peptidase PppA n=1 Tax=Thalassoglobus polymorphus TaxID=2527994 RepID=A0A517QUW6_9PLAN|nr:A24 family peptidase [Thalassoglobus polymorphus]QDT35404.1 Leader peptidase PppA [Thalassoglobus polymorphus]